MVTRLARLINWKFVALGTLLTLRIGVGSVTENGFQPDTEQSLWTSCAHSVSDSLAVPASNTAPATLAGATLMVWPPVCAALLMTNWPPANVPLESHSCSVW